MKHISKLISTVFITAAFAYSIKILSGCWPCCSFLFLFLCVACIWAPGMKIRLRDDDDNDVGDDING